MLPGDGISDSNDGNEETENDMQSDRNDSRGDDKKTKNRNKSKDVEQCPFEIIYNVAKTMKKLENIVMDHYCDSGKSEKSFGR